MSVISDRKEKGANTSKIENKVRARTEVQVREMKVRQIRREKFRGGPGERDFSGRTVPRSSRLSVGTATQDSVCLDAQPAIAFFFAHTL